MEEVKRNRVLRIFNRFESAPFLNSIRTDTAQHLKWLFLALCRELKIMNLVEIGAYEASVSVDFLEASPGTRALAIEANPFTYELMTRETKKYGVETLNLGLSHSVATLDFFIPLKEGSANVTPGSASFLRRNDKNSLYKTISVPTKTIDLVFESQLIEGRTALWIDVEGYSLNVLQGAKNELEKEDIRMVFIELETYEYWQKQGTRNEVSEILQRNGFVLLRRDFEYKFQHNYLFIRANELTHAIKVVNQYDQKFKSLLLKAIRDFPALLLGKAFEKVSAKLKNT